MKKFNLILKNRRVMAVITACIAIILFVIVLSYNYLATNKNVIKWDNIAFNLDENSEFIYLSDLEYITANNWSYNGWDGHTLQKDKNPEGGPIKLLVDGKTTTYLKGMGVHAKGQLTYNIESLSSKYTRFTAKIGLDASRTTAGNIHFEISVSSDGENWDLLKKTGNITPGQEAIDVDLDVTNQRYLRIYVDPNGANSADHGVVANAKLTVEGYEEAPFVEYDKLKDISYYDNILSAPGYDYNTDAAHRLIMEREFVRKIGYDNINLLVNFDKKNKETLDWIVDNTRVLEACVEVGDISNTITFLNIVQNLYHHYKADLISENGDVYEKMIIGLAAGYSTDRTSSPLTFGHQTPGYDYMERFAIIKELYDKDLMLYSKGWKTYHVDFFRYLMNDSTRNDELKWMNYIGKAKNYSTGVYSYVQYISPNYSMSAKPYLYDIANKGKYEDKYHLEEYGVPFADATTRYWMVMEAGGICWNQARTTKSVLIGMGRPAITVYQPDHESALFYVAENNDGTGKGKWDMAGNIFGWGKTSNAWYGGNRTRTILGWSNKSFTFYSTNATTSGDSSGYVYLAQANLNNYDAYKASLYLNLLANSFTSSEDKLKLYNDALKLNSINLDSYDYKIKMYKDLEKTSEEWYQLALDIIDNYTFYPMAMGDLINIIKPYLNGINRVDIDQRYYNALLRAKSATPSDSWQNSATQAIANARLGSANGNLATFSFDGANAGKIILSKDYDTFKDLMWKYSLDGGTTKSEGTISHELQLSPEEIAKINDENDIKLYVVGLTEAKPTYTIDIVKGTLSDTLFANDLENRVVGVGLNYEWRENEFDEWTSYATSSPNCVGEKTLYVRASATGNKLASDSATYTFTEDNQPDTRKYVPVSHLSIHGASTEATSNAGAATYAIDGNYNTRYHSAWNGTDTERYVIIKIDKPIFLSAVEFVPAGGGNGKIVNGTIYGSMDGETWTELVHKEGITYNPSNVQNSEQAKNNTKSFDLSDSQQVQYVKIKADKTNGNWFAARAFNIYQDVTKRPHPTAGIAFSETEPTKNDVVVRLVNPSTDIKITNNNGSDTYTFTENGEFKFEFVETNCVGECKTGSAIANVTWIDKEAPTATIEYSTTNKTNKGVIATLKPSEDVIVTNNGNYSIDSDGNILDKNGNVIEGYTIDENHNIKDVNGNIITNLNTFTYEFYTNAEFTFEFKDKAGNKGSATAKVDWIDTTAPIGTLFYDITGTTNQNVTVHIEFNEDAVVTNNNGSIYHTFTENGEFTFEFKDTAGNRNSLTAKVHWMDKEIPTAELEYDIREDKVIVKVVNPSKEITFKEGIGVYEFVENGTYEIVFYDHVGNEGKLLAVIDSFKTNNDNNNNNQQEKPNNNKPVNPSNSSNNNSNNTNVGNNNGNTNTTNPINIEYKKFVYKGIHVEVPANDINKEVILNVENFSLPYELRDKFSSKSEFYDIYFEDDSNKIDVSSDSLIKISMKLNNLKEFSGIYELTSDNTLKPVNYVRNGNNIEITTNSIGKYIVSYEEEIEEKPTSEPITPEKTPTESVAKPKENNKNIIIIATAGVSVASLGIFTYLVKAGKIAIGKKKSK